MNLKIDDYVNTLLSNEISVSELDNAKKILSVSDELIQILNSPSVSKEEKKKVVDEIFSFSVKSIVLHLAEECKVDELGSVIDAYSAELDKKNRVARATLICVTEPDEKQLKGIEEFVCKEENAGSAKIEIVKDNSLIGGFIIRIGNKQYDRSLKSKALKKKLLMMQENPPLLIQTELYPFSEAKLRIMILKQTVKRLERLSESAMA